MSSSKFLSVPAFILWLQESSFLSCLFSSLSPGRRGGGRGRRGRGGFSDWDRRRGWPDSSRPGDWGGRGGAAPAAEEGREWGGPGIGERASGHEDRKLRPWDSSWAGASRRRVGGKLTYLKVLTDCEMGFHLLLPGRWRLDWNRPENICFDQNFSPLFLPTFVAVYSSHPHN